MAAPPPLSSPAAAAPALAGKAHAPWSEVILLASLSMFGSVAMDMYLPALPSMTRDLAISPAAGQATVSIFLIGLAAGQLVFGPLSDRVGRRRPILFGVALFLAASGVCAVAASGWVLIGARFLQALGACAGMVVARAVVRDRYDDHEVLHVFSLLSLVFGIAPVLAPLIGGWVLTAADWRWIFAVQAAFGLAVGLAAFLRLPESRREATRRQALSENTVASYLALLRQPLLLGYLLTGAFSGAALFAYITQAPSIVMVQFHIPAAHFGWVFGVNAVGLAGAGQFNARLARRIPGDTLLQTALLASVAAASMLVIDAWTGWGGMWGVFIPLFVVLSGFGVSQPNTSAAAMTVDRHRAGSTAALLGVGFFGVGSLIGGVTILIPATASQAMAAVILVSLLLALASYRLLVRPHRRGAAPINATPPPEPVEF